MGHALLVFIAGGLIGFAGGFVTAEKLYNSDEGVIVYDATHECEHETQQGPVFEEPQEVVYTGHFVKSTTPEAEKPGSEKPHVITEEDWNYAYAEAETQRLTFYRGSNLLVDVDEEMPVDDPESEFGVTVMNWLSITADETVYLYNDYTGICTVIDIDENVWAPELKER